MKAFLSPSSYVEKYEDKLHEITEIKIQAYKLDDSYMEIFERFIQKCIDAKAPLQTYSLTDCTTISALPSILQNTSIKNINITNCNQFVDLGAVIRDYPNLEHLYFKGKKVILGQTTFSLNNLKSLTLDANNIDTLDGFSNCKNLEQLSFNELEVQTLPSFDNFSKLTHLTLTNLRALQEFNIDFNKLPSLTNLLLKTIGQTCLLKELPATLFTCKNIQEINLTNLSTIELPKELGNFKKLERLHLENMNLISLPDIFDQLKNLKWFNLYKCNQVERLPNSFKDLSELDSFGIMYNDKIQSIDFTNHHLQKIKEFSIYCLNALENFHFDTTNCEALQSISFYRSNNILALSENIYAAKNLKKVILSQLPKLKKIPTSLANHAELTNINVENCSALEFIPNNIFPPAQFMTINFSNNNSTKFNDVLKETTYEVNRHIDIKDKSIILNWMLHKEKEFPISKEIGRTILNTMALGNKRLNNILFTEVQNLNPNGTPVDSKVIADGGKVFISGRLVGGKDGAKSKLEQLGLSLATKLTDDVKFILLANKPKVTADFFNGNRYFFSQTELESLKKELHPEFLQTNNISIETVEKINDLIYTNNDVNLNLAFEMVNQHGLPSELEESFLALFHTLPKGNKLRLQIKRFLKGKISKKKDLILEAKSYPFSPHKVRDSFNAKEATQIFYTLYRRTGKLDPEFFKNCALDNPIREKMFEVILPTITKNPKRINIEARLSAKELTMILQLPKLKNHLYEAIFFITENNALEALKLHKESLKKLKLVLFPTCTIFPKCIYEMANLIELTIAVIDGITTIPEGIGALTKLKTLSFRNQSAPFQLPNDLVELKKLKKINCYPNSSFDAFKEKMNWVKFDGY